MSLPHTSKAARFIAENGRLRMRILVTSQPGLGHLNGIVELCRTLKADGHDVLAAGAPSVVEAFRRAGIAGYQIVPEPLWSDAEDTLREIPALASAPPSRRLGVLRSELSVRRRAIALVEPLLEIAQSLRPAVILRDATELAGWVAAERLEIPDVSFEVSAHWPRERWSAEVGDAIIELRKHAGIPEFKDDPARTMYRHMHINNAPPSLLAEGVALPSTAVDLKPVFFEHYEGEPVGEGLEGHVYVAFGSVYNAPGDVVTAIIDRLSEVFPAVLVAGRTPSPRPSVLSWPFIPQTPAMHGCAVVLCHGGRNTVLTAMRHGVPVVCLPLGSDNFDIADRVAQAGAGVTAEWVADLASAAVKRVGTQTAYRHGAQRLATEIAAMAPARQVAAEMARRFG